MMSKFERAFIMFMLHFILLCVTHEMFPAIAWAILVVVSPVGMHFVYRSIFSTKE
jgi:hypothetical protein